MIDIFVVDDRDVIRRGLVGLITESIGLRVTGEARSVDEARRRIPLAGASVLIGGPQLIARLRTSLNTSTGRSSALVIATQIHIDDEGFHVTGEGTVIRASQAAAEIVDLVKRVATRHVRPRTHPAMRKRPGSVGDTRLSALNPREREVLTLIATGKTNREVGAVLGLSEKTVKNYASTIYAKLGVQHRIEAALVKFAAERISA